MCCLSQKEWGPPYRATLRKIDYRQVHRRERWGLYQAFRNMEGPGGYGKSNLSNQPDCSQSGLSCGRPPSIQCPSPPWKQVGSLRGHLYKPEIHRGEFTGTSISASSAAKVIYWPRRASIQNQQWSQWVQKSQSQMGALLKEVIGEIQAWGRVSRWINGICVIQDYFKLLNFQADTTELISCPNCSKTMW
jgi:hypothetical protein